MLRCVSRSWVYMSKFGVQGVNDVQTLLGNMSKSDVLSCSCYVCYMVP